MRRALLDRPTRTQRASTVVFPAPVEGWDTSESLSGMSPLRALQLDNFFPRSDYIEVRRGHLRHAAIQNETGVVESLMPFHGRFTSRLFAAVGDAIYDVTAPSMGRAGNPVVTATGGSRFQHINFAGSIGSALWICNGVSAPRFFTEDQGWQTANITPASSTTDIFEPTAIIGCEAYKGRIWTVFRGSTQVGYLGVDRVQGPLTTYELGGIMSKGGFVQAIATWSLDGGDGPDDYLVFVTSRGQAIVFGGLDPSDPAGWSLVGVYDIGTPIGRRCVLKIGADLAILCTDGVKPLSQVSGLNRAAQERVSVSQRIARAVSDSARAYGSLFGWEMALYPRGASLVVNVPIIEGEISHQYVMNTETGAWCRFTGQNAACWVVFEDRLLFGGRSSVMEADVSGSDSTGPVVADLKTAFNYARGTNNKRWMMAQPLLNSDEGLNVAIGVDTDFREGRDLRPLVSQARQASRWGQMVWGEGEWSIPVTQRNDWFSIDGLGQCAAVRLRIILGEGSDLTKWNEFEWGEGTWSDPVQGETLFQVNGFNVSYERGGIL